MPTDDRPSTSSYDTIERIRREVAASPCSLLDRKLIDVQLITKAVDAFRISDGRKTIRCDIPIHSVVSLDRINDTWFDGDTWRDVLQKRLHGTDWPPDVFEYFENEIGDKRFPAPNARGQLKLLSYGGVSICLNGNHRLAAAYCWLAATMGGDACLKSVDTYFVPIDRAKVRLVLKAAKDSRAGISVCTVRSELQWKTYIRSVSNGKSTYYGLDDGLHVLWPINHGLLGKLKLLISPDYAQRCLDIREFLENQEWCPIPQYVLDVWVTEGWFDDLYAQA